jgi:purine-nucleoside phosphorylase
MDPATKEQELSAALAKVKQLVPANLLTPIVAIVCGSGLSTLASAITEAVVIPYVDLPGFLTSQGMYYLG